MKNKLGILLIISLLLTGCSKKMYKVTFDTNGGNEIEPIIIKEGENLKDIEEPKKDGYLFVNWHKSGIEYNLDKPVNEDITLTANWVEEPIIPNTYTITLVIDDKIEKTVVKENDTINEPKIPKKDNYRILGWYLDDKKYDFNTKITSDITLVAKYELNIVTVIFDLNGGVGLALVTIPKNSTIKIPETPQKPGYRFLKWTLNGKDFSFTTKITKNITLKAVWELIEYVTITFDTNDGTIIESQKIEKYSKIDELPIPNKDGYKFIGWYLDELEFDNDKKIDKDITLKAIYERIEQ